MEVYENSIMYIFSFLLGLILYYIIYYILVNGLFAEIIFSNYAIKIPVVFILFVALHLPVCPLFLSILHLCGHILQ